MDKIGKIAEFLTKTQINAETKEKIRSSALTNDLTMFNINRWFEEKNERERTQIVEDIVFYVGYMNGSRRAELVESDFYTGEL